MARFNIKKPNVKDKAHLEQVAHKHVPGRAYDITNPVDRLINMVGGGFFNEPKYYDSNRSAEQFYKELHEKGVISSTVTDETGLTEQAIDVVGTAVAVTKGEYEGSQPDDLFVIAAWARDTENGLKLRTTPQILCAIGAKAARSRPYVDRYAQVIMKRPDDVVQTFAAYREMYHPKVNGLHKGSLPHALRRGLKLALAGFSDYQILKYHRSTRPNIRDVALMINGRPGNPFSKAMFNYIVNNSIAQDAPDVLLARKQLFATEDINQVTPELLKRAQITWENVSSQFGDKEGTNPKVWEMVIPYMNEMALVRNLRNFEQAGISEKSWKEVTNKLLDVEKTNQLPFRFFTADKVVTTPNSKAICELMLDRSVVNLPDLKGITVVFNDNSGSTVGCSVGKDSTLTVADAGNMLGAVAAKRYGENVKIGVFGDAFIWVNHNPDESCIQIKKNIDRIAQVDERSAHKSLGIENKYFSQGNGVGGMTETGLWFGIKDLIERKVKVDRIILCSDMCCYTQGNVNCGIDMTQHFGKNATIQGMIDEYRAKVNPDLKVYSVNLNGHEQAQVRSDKNTHRISGWSENIFRVISDLEITQLENNIEERTLPTLEVLRQRYKV